MQENSPTNSQPNLFAVILAGGSGERFWPASRRTRPKQFLSIGSKLPLIGLTYQRLAGLVPPERVLVVTSDVHASLVHEALPDLPAENVLAEPQGRNTLPCAALAAFEIERRSPGAVQVLLPSDHLIQPVEDFRKTLLSAARSAHEKRGVVLLGIRPRFAATGYGYIETGAPVVGHEGLLEVERFVEKPNAERAAEFLAGGRHLWNGGVFVWPTDVFLEMLATHAPAVHAGLASARPDDLVEAYAALPKVSIDIGLMEKLSELYVLPLDVDWNDVGSWSALADVVEKDAHGNAVDGGAKLLAHESHDCIVYGPPGSLTALVGVEGLVVVHVRGATLVCPRERAEEVRAIATRLDGEAPEFR